MSLINDALRRAREAQPPPASHAPPPQFRADEPAAHVHPGLGVMVPIAFGLVALLTLLLLWVLARGRSGNPPARTPGIVQAQSAAVPASEAAMTRVPTPPPASEPVQPSSQKSHAAGTETALEVRAMTRAEPTASHAEPSPKSGVSAPAEPGTNVTIASAPEPPKPAPLKLQGIVFDPRRPSALIRGKTLFIGDPVDDFRIVAVHADSVILVGAGKTNILRLEQ